MFGLFGTRGLTPEDAARLRRVERKLDLILAHSGIVYDPAGCDLPAEVRGKADAGDKIGAIKEHRRLTGLGLAESLRAVDAYLAERPASQGATR